MSQNAFNFREIQERQERLAPGHRMCAGCGGSIAVRNVLKALHPGDKAVVGNATGCLEVSTYMYPYTAYEDSYIHSAFEKFSIGHALWNYKEKDFGLVDERFAEVKDDFIAVI